MNGFVKFAIEPLAQKLAKKGLAEVKHTAEYDEYTFFYLDEYYYVIKCSGSIPEITAKSTTVDYEYTPRVEDVYKNMERALSRGSFEPDMRSKALEKLKELQKEAEHLLWPDEVPTRISEILTSCNFKDIWDDLYNELDIIDDRIVIEQIKNIVNNSDDEFLVGRLSFFIGLVHGSGDYYKFNSYRNLEDITTDDAEEYIERAIEKISKLEV